jgi:hypothetical protein
MGVGSAFGIYIDYSYISKGEWGRMVPFYFWGHGEWVGFAYTIYTAGKKRYRI